MGVECYLSPVISVMYPAGKPPLRRPSRLGSRVLIASHFFEISIPVPRSEECVVSESSPARPRSRWSALRTSVHSRLTSSTGMFARLARAAGSRARRSVVLTPCLSSEGRMRAYGAVGKAGRMDERSVMEAFER
jgi:hypothetical protein